MPGQLGGMMSASVSDSFAHLLYAAEVRFVPAAFVLDDP